MKKIALAISFLFMQALLASVDVYKVTENTGLNKLERIDSIETYLVSLSAGLKNLESKMEEQTKKIEAMNKIVTKLEDNDAKRVKAALGGPITSLEGATGEIERLRKDFTAIKNDEIEKLKKDILIIQERVQDIRERVQ